MGDDGKVPAPHLWQREYTSHGGQFLARITAHDACLTEQRLYCRVARCDGTSVTRCSAASALTRSSLDGCYTASLANQATGVEQQFVGVRDILYVKQFHLRVGFGVKVLVHVLQHVLYANLLAVAYRPHAVELQPLDDGTLEDEHCRGTGAADEVDALRVQVRDGEREDAMVTAVQQADAVRPYQGCPVMLAGGGCAFSRRALSCGPMSGVPGCA